MFSPAQASVSLRPFPPIPMQAMFNLLLRFCPRTNAGTPNASAPAARELVLIKLRRSTRGTAVSGVLREGNFSVGFDTRTEYTAPLLLMRNALLGSDPPGRVFNKPIGLSPIDDASRLVA